MIAAAVRSGLILVFLAVSVTVAQADRQKDIDRLIELLDFEQTIEIMREEGLRYGGQVAQDMLPGADMESWQAAVSRIYDAQKMLSLISADFHKELERADLAPMLAYFDTPDGREIIQLELAGRRAFLDPQVEQESIAGFNEGTMGDARLQDQVAQFIDEGDLVEFNVMGTLNSSMMFYRGLRDGGAMDVTEQDLLTDFWAQEDDARRNASEWLGAFLTLAYQPLTPEQLDHYIAFFRTPEGRDLNRAIFAVFDQMYAEISYLIGLAVADHMASEPL